MTLAELIEELQAIENECEINSLDISIVIQGENGLEYDVLLPILVTDRWGTRILMSIVDFEENQNDD